MADRDAEEAEGSQRLYKTRVCQASQHTRVVLSAERGVGLKLNNGSEDE